MRARRRVLFPALMGIGLVACVADPTSPRADRNSVPALPRFDGGHMLGSGGFVDSTQTTSGAASVSGAAATMPGDSTQRGGHTLGSGA